MTAEALYLGDLRTQLTHLSSKEIIFTDAPVDNQGKGKKFSPTDLVASALASCIITIMGIKANSLGIELGKTHASIVKVMAANPRRISEIHIQVTLPKSIPNEFKKPLEKAGINCPVAKSLHADLQQKITFQYTL